jgi:hypothetical protein
MFSPTLRFTLVCVMLIGFLQTYTAQKPHRDSIPQGGKLILTDGTVLLGKIIHTTSPYQIVILTKDTLTVEPMLTDKVYLPTDITLFGKSKFHYNRGLQFGFNTGFSVNHRRFDMELRYMFNKKWAVGLGLGFHNNSFSFSTANSNHNGDVRSIPVYVTGNYFLSNTYFKPYLKAKIGYSNNFTTFDVNSVSDGIILEGGLGVSFTSKTQSKFYLELSQYTTNAKGTMRNNNPNGLGDIGFDLWFNRVVFTFGYTFGR